MTFNHITFWESIDVCQEVIIVVTDPMNIIQKVF